MDGRARRIAAVAVVVAGVAVTVAAVLGSVAAAQPWGSSEKPLDLRRGIYEWSGVLDTFPPALPGFVAGALAVILVMHVLGFFEMGLSTAIVVAAAIAAIIYRFYWHG